MKTYEEALGLFSDANTAESIDECFDKKKELRAEIFACPGTCHIIHDLLMIGHDNPPACVLTAFMFGIWIGIEMEKAELSEVTA